jgi:hypothetical protein
MLVTCHTPDCENNGIAIDLTLTYTDETGETVNVDAVACGVCGQEITDIGARGA